MYICNRIKANTPITNRRKEDEGTQTFTHEFGDYKAHSTPTFYNFADEITKTNKQQNKS